MAGRYALALLSLAEEQKALDQVAEDLVGLKALIKESADLRRLLRSPLLRSDVKAEAMKTIMEKAGVGELTCHFVLVVAGNRRLFALPEMIEAYLAELSRRRGEVTAHVTSAVALTDEQRRGLEETLRSFAGAKVRMDLRVDESLIGGLIVRVGSRMIDTSLSTKLERLELAMKGVG